MHQIVADIHADVQEKIKDIVTPSVSFCFHGGCGKDYRLLAETNR